MKLATTLRVSRESGIDMDLIWEAERLGYDVVWCGEAYGTGCGTPVAWVLAQTKKIKAGTSIPKPGGQVRSGLSAGGKRIRTLGPAERKGRSEARQLVLHAPGFAALACARAGSPIIRGIARPNFARSRRIERLGFRAHHHRDAGRSPLAPSPSTRWRK